MQPPCRRSMRGAARRFRSGPIRLNSIEFDPI